MPAHPCPVCEIAAARAEASIVHQDEHVMAFMYLHPVTIGHLLVVPRAHSVGLEDLDGAAGEHVWSLAHRMALPPRRPLPRISALTCSNVYRCRSRRCRRTAVVGCGCAPGAAHSGYGQGRAG